MHFDVLNRLGVAHECVGQTDRQTDRQTDITALAIVRSNDRAKKGKP